MEQCDLIILVYACYTIDRYRDEMHVINKTWGKKCQEYPNIRLIYFLGEEKLDIPEFQDTPVTKYVNLPGVGNDYQSASYKQWLGMKYIYENYIAKFVHCLGTDTYVNVPKMLSYLDTFNPNKCIYLGGHGDCRDIGTKNYYNHSGGAGFVLSYGTISMLYPILDHITDDWIRICNEKDVAYLHPACDVAAAYYLQQPGSPVYVIKADDEFLTCNHLGWPCHLHKVDMSKILSCHCMQPHDSIQFTQILEENNYYV